MTEIPKEALDKADELFGGNAYGVLGTFENVASYIADVSAKAKRVYDIGRLSPEQLDIVHSLILLPNPEDDLLKEAREIVAATPWDGELADDYAVRCTLAALKGRK